MNFFRKKGEEPKKAKRPLRSRVKVNTNQEKEIDERIPVLVTKLSLLALRLGIIITGIAIGGGPALLDTPMFIHKIFEQNFYQYVQ